MVTRYYFNVGYFRPWEPADTFNLYQPPPWPSEHTDQGSDHDPNQSPENNPSVGLRN